MKKLNLIILLSILFVTKLINAPRIYTGGPPVATTIGIISFANKLYAPTTAGVFVSTNQGANWSNSSTGLPRGAGDDETLIAYSNWLFVSGFGYGIFYSVDNGQTLYPRGSGAGNYIRAIRVDGTNLFCGGAYSGAYLSTNAGANGFREPMAFLRPLCR